MRSIILMIIVFVTTGCASINKGNYDTIMINSLEKGTTIYVDGAPRGIDNAAVNVKKGKPHALRVEKDGCTAVSGDSGESFDPTTLLGFLVDFGLVSIPIDLISGAAWRIEPTTYTLTPICKK